jgi:DMSO/TMAO reductase YedYZ molybdopterin-dependent catalytic subunit
MMAARWIDMRFRTRHWRHVLVMGFLFLTGFGLFLTSWRTALGPLLPTDQAVHELGGLVYGAAVLGLGARFFPWPPAGRPAYARWAFFFLIMLVVSGVGLLVGPSWVHALATVLHAATATAFVVWAGWHLVQHWPVRERRPATPVGRAVTRRAFLRWAGAAVVGLPAWLSLPTMARVVTGSIGGSVAGTNADALPGFVPYTVVNGFPTLPRDRWRLVLEGLGPARSWTWDEWVAQPMREIVFNFRCVTGWDVPGVHARGVDLLGFLERQGWDPERHPWVLFVSGDGVYTESLSAEQIRQYRPLMAAWFDGKPLPRSQGYPVRLLVPGMYGYKSIKWLVGIRLMTQEELGYWEVRGYPENAYIGSYSPLSLSGGRQVE